MKTRVQFVLFAGSCVCSDSRYRWYLVSVCVCDSANENVNECLRFGEFAQVLRAHWPAFGVVWDYSSSQQNVKWMAELNSLIDAALKRRSICAFCFFLHRSVQQLLHVHISITVQHLYYHGNTRMFRPVLLWVCERACVLSLSRHQVFCFPQ